MRQPKAGFATVVRMPPRFRRRMTKKEPRRPPWPAAALEERIEEIMDRVQKAVTIVSGGSPRWRSI
jgi:hypothetical protein